VLTAGGAASPGRSQGKQDPRRNKPKENVEPEFDLLDKDNNINASTKKSAASSTGYQKDPPPNASGNNNPSYAMEYEESERENDDGTNLMGNDNRGLGGPNSKNDGGGFAAAENEAVTPVKITDLYQEPPQSSKAQDLIWLFLCFIGIMASFVCYGLLLEYTTSGGRKLHELSFLFVTSGLYTLTAAAGRYVRGEQHTTIPPSRFAILGLTSMGSTFTSVRSLR
jgi:hypothetical protein